MAYKFQMGDARLSGSVRQEGTVRADQDVRASGKVSASSDVYGLQIRTADTVRIGSDGALSNIGAITQTAGNVTLDGAGDVAIDVAADSIYFRDSGDGTMRRDTVADLATGMAGLGLSAASGQFALDLNELTAETLASGDFLAFVDSTDNGTHKETVDDLATLFAGDGLSASSAVLAVNVDDSSIETNADSLRVKALGVTNAMLAGSIADSKLLQITTGDKVAGSAVQLAGTSAFEDSTGLRLKAATAGNGLSMSSQVLAVEVSGAVKIASDKVGISGSIAGSGLGYDGGEDSISSLAVNVDDSSIEINSDSLRVKAAGITDAMLNDDVATGLAGVGLSAASGVMALDLNELTAETLASGDFLAFVDSTDNGTHKETVDDLATLFAGNGLSAASAVMALDLNELTAAGGQLTPANDSIAFIDADDTNASKKISMLNFVAGLPHATDSGLMSQGGQLKLSINDLGAGTVAVAADSIAILDADDNVSKKESIVDFVAGIAGAGLSSASGQLSVQGNAVASFGDEDATAAEGFNYGTATLTANRTITLPAAPAVGDVIHVKAPPSLGGFNLIIAKAGTQTIDGATEVRIESGDGAVSLVYAVANKWKLF